MKWKLLLVFPLLSMSLWGAVAHTHDDAGFATTAAHAGNITANMATAATVTTNFTYTSSGTGNGVLFALDCAATAATPSAVTLTATGWTLVQVGSITGNTTGAGWMAIFKAYSPNTSAATFTATWTVSSGGCNSFISDLAGEFSGMDSTNFVDASHAATGASGCNASGTVTPVASNDGIWFACGDNVSGTVYTGGYTKGGDDTDGDTASWKILSGGAGVAQTPGYPTTTGANVIFGIAILPASGGGGATSAPSKRAKLKKVDL